MSHKKLHKWSIKKDSQNQRIFIKSLYLQTNLRNKDIDAIYIDELCFHYESRVYRGWGFKGKHSGVCETNKNVLLSAILTLSELHFTVF